MSAIANDSDGPNELIKVLFAVYDGVDSLALTGPLSIFTAAHHNPKDPSTEAFDLTICGPSTSAPVMTKQGLAILPQLSYKDAHSALKDYDMLVIPSGSSIDSVLKADSEPIPLIKAFVEVQEADPGRERTLFSVDTGSHLLAKVGALKGFAATTHPDSYIALELLGQQASAYESTDRTDVMDDRYIVNNARFDLGDDLSSNPFVIGKAEAEIMSKKDRRRSSNARKGSFALRESNFKGSGRREALRLGGMRTVTAGGSASGADAALYLVAALVSVEAAEEAARRLQVNWTRGVVVDSIDV